MEHPQTQAVQRNPAECRAEGRDSVFRNDYILRQIDSLVMVLSKILFGKTTPVYERQDEISPTAGDRLHDALRRLLEANSFNEAENLLFERLEAGIEGGLSLMLDFYHRLNLLSDEQLARAGFPRGEIDAGLRDALNLLGLSDVLESCAGRPEGKQKNPPG